MLSVMYKHKRITVGVGMGNPFVDNYKRINETWNFPFGRNYQSGGKKILPNNEFLQALSCSFYYFGNISYIYSLLWLMSNYRRARDDAKDLDRDI